MTPPQDDHHEEICRCHQPKLYGHLHPACPVKKANDRASAKAYPSDAPIQQARERLNDAIAEHGFGKEYNQALDALILAVQSSHASPDGEDESVRRLIQILRETPFPPEFATKRAAELLEQFAAVHALEQSHASQIQGFQKEKEEFMRAPTTEANSIADHTEPRPTCGWRFDDDDTEGESWIGACGARWILGEGTPVDHQMRFCMVCGRPLKLIDRVVDAWQDKACPTFSNSEHDDNECKHCGWDEESHDQVEIANAELITCLLCRGQGRCGDDVCYYCEGAGTVKAVTRAQYEQLMKSTLPYVPVAVVEADGDSLSTEVSASTVGAQRKDPDFLLEKISHLEAQIVTLEQERHQQFIEGYVAGSMDADEVDPSLYRQNAEQEWQIRQRKNSTSPEAQG